jgi:hypothetical protein
MIGTGAFSKWLPAKGGELNKRGAALPEASNVFDIATGFDNAINQQI